MNTDSIIPTGGDSGLGNLQRIQPTSDFDRRDRPRPRRRVLEKTAPKASRTIYTPEGRFEPDEHGLVLDISA